MSLQRLYSRLATVEAQRRPAVVAAVLERVRPPSALGAVLLAELTARDRATCDAIMDQLTDTELEMLIGPDAVRLMDTLSDAELEALAGGDAGVLQRFKHALQRWRNGRS